MLLSPPTLAMSTRATTSKVTLESFIPVRRCKPLPPSRRPFSSCRPLRSDHNGADISSQIRSLMRESAQPVALITTFLPPSSGRLIHGATLSSFSSISLNPDLVCFSMKTPSKLADALKSHVDSRKEDGEVDMVINVLGEEQGGLAGAYARPGTPPLAYTGEEGGSEKLEGELHPLEEVGLVEVGREGGLPVVKGCIGALGCQVVDSIDLQRYSTESTQGESRSRLYIAKVINVHLPEATDSTTQRPLIYHRQRFVTTTKQ